MAVVSMNQSQFERELNRWARQHIPDIGKQVHSEVTEAVFKGVLMRTPVLTGLARGNWWPTLGAPDPAAQHEIFGGSVTGEPITGSEKSRGKSVTEKLKGIPLGSSKTFITNNLEYIIPLEEGTSPKSGPKAMVEGTIINVLDALKVTIKVR